MYNFKSHFNINNTYEPKYLVHVIQIYHIVHNFLFEQIPHLLIFKILFI